MSATTRTIVRTTDTGGRAGRTILALLVAALVAAAMLVAAPSPAARAASGIGKTCSGKFMMSKRLSDGAGRFGPAVLTTYYSEANNGTVCAIVRNERHQARPMSLTLRIHGFDGRKTLGSKTDRGNFPNYAGTIWFTGVNCRSYSVAGALTEGGRTYGWQHWGPAQLPCLGRQQTNPVLTKCSGKRLTAARLTRTDSLGRPVAGPGTVELWWSPSGNGTVCAIAYNEKHRAMPLFLGLHLYDRSEKSVAPTRYDTGRYPNYVGAIYFTNARCRKALAIANFWVDGLAYNAWSQNGTTTLPC